MAASTTPDAIVYPQSTDQVSPLETVFANMANSVQTAMNFRGIYTFRWTNAAARTAQTGMRVGDYGYQIDTQYTYRYTGSAWGIWDTFGTALLANVTLASGVTYLAGQGLNDLSIRGGLCVFTYSLNANSAIAYNTTWCTLGPGFTPLGAPSHTMADYYDGGYGVVPVYINQSGAMTAGIKVTGGTTATYTINGTAIYRVS